MVVLHVHLCPSVQFPAWKLGEGVAGSHYSPAPWRWNANTQMICTFCPPPTNLGDSSSLLMGIPSGKTISVIWVPAGEKPSDWVALHSHQPQFDLIIMQPVTQPIHIIIGEEIARRGP